MHSARNSSTEIDLPGDLDGERDEKPQVADARPSTRSRSSFYSVREHEQHEGDECMMERSYSALNPTLSQASNMLVVEEILDRWATLYSGMAERVACSNIVLDLRPTWTT